jgi:hypothetical protein
MEEAATTTRPRTDVPGALVLREYPGGTFGAVEMKFRTWPIQAHLGLDRAHLHHHRLPPPCVDPLPPPSASLTAKAAGVDAATA